MIPSPLLRERLLAALAVLGGPHHALEPALEALALCAAAGATGALDTLPARERKAATAAGARLLLAARRDAAEDDSLALAVSLAGEGLEALRGTAPRPARSPLHPSPAALVAMSRGEPDGLTAATTAAHVRRCEACRAALSVATASADARAEPVRLAAASTAVRAPARGKRVGLLSKLAVEAVLFEDGGVRRIAVYGPARASLRLVAGALTTEEQRPGYWLGRVTGKAARLDCTLHFDDARVAWKLPLR